jgi:outer membrane assembly lipoprotein YfiO
MLEPPQLGRPRNFRENNGRRAIVQGGARRLAQLPGLNTIPALMIRQCHWAVLLGVVLLAAVAAAPAMGQAPAPDTRPAPLLQSNPTLDRAEKLLEKHHWQAAHDLIVPWLKSQPKARDRDRGLYLLAEVYHQNGDRVRAFYHLDELMDNFPESRLFFPALQFQYDIAVAYLDGYKDTFLGLPVVAMTDEAIEMLYRIQERSPGSPLAEQALKRTADYYFAHSEFDLARDAYNAFVQNYPRSPEVPQVRLRAARCSLAQFRGPRFESSTLIDARAQFKELEAKYPSLAAYENLDGQIDVIDAELARKAYLSGDFYRRTNHPRGAVFMYRYVVGTYPNSHEADLCRRALASMPASALVDPPPPPGNPESAATQPAGGSGPGSSERSTP